MLRSEEEQEEIHMMQPFIRNFMLQIRRRPYEFHRARYRGWYSAEIRDKLDTSESVSSP